MKQVYPDPAELAPHDPPMLLVDQIVSTNSEEIVAKIKITPDNLFFIPGRGVPAYVGFEIMAQAIAVQDGFNRHSEGLGTKIGFLLGCRKYTVTQDWFFAEEVLTVKAKALLSEGEMQSFDCVIESEQGEKLAAGAINVFSPENPEEFIKKGGSGS